jgi:hypothetical protein
VQQQLRVIVLIKYNNDTQPANKSINNIIGFDMNIYYKKVSFYSTVLMTTVLLAACGSDYNDDYVEEVKQEQEYVFAPTLSYEVVLSGTQQVPRNTSTQTATAIIEVDEDDKIFRVNMDISEINGFAAAHLHEGGLGQNGAVIYAITESSGSAYGGSETNNAELAPITVAIIDSLKAGNVYVNLHTADFADGEIRAQVVPDTVIITSFTLDGSQEVPSLETSAYATGYASYNSASMALKLRVNTQNLEDATAAHIHTGRIGKNGGVLLALEADADAGTDTYSWNAPADASINAATFDILSSGGHYVNIHTPSNPSGEIRGQILTPNFQLLTFPLQGSQEVPAVSTTAGGDGYLLLNTEDYAVELVALLTGVETATMAHIHTGRVGENGSVLVALEQSGDDVNSWVSSEGLSIDEAIFDVLISGGHYVNVHTPANPGGELRGQILTDDYVLATFPLQSSQEVPAVASSASGNAYALINKNTFSVEIKVLTEGVMNATMAHIHTGRIGTNGAVLVGLEQSSDDLNMWMTPADLSINADIFAVLATGGHYVNVHTPAYPNGELRGQILTDNYLLFSFPLNGAQEIPTVETDASGSGYALVDQSNFGLELVAVTQGADDATMAHIHAAQRGENGPVLVGLARAEDSLNVWMSPADLTLDAAVYSQLVSGGHYVNVHTPANSNGEVRGQIE